MTYRNSYRTNRYFVPVSTYMTLTFNIMGWYKLGEMFFLNNFVRLRYYIASYFPLLDFRQVPNLAVSKCPPPTLRTLIQRWRLWRGQVGYLLSTINLQARYCRIYIFDLSFRGQVGYYYRLKYFLLSIICQHWENWPGGGGLGEAR